MFSQRGERIALNQQVGQQIDFQKFDMYVKRQSSKSSDNFEDFLDSIQQLDQDDQKQQNKKQSIQMSPTFQFKQNQRFFSMQKQKEKQKIRKSEMNITKALKQKLIIDKFKNNLFQSSSILQQRDQQRLDYTGYLYDCINKQTDLITTRKVQQLSNQNFMSTFTSNLNKCYIAKILSIWNIISFFISIYSFWFCLLQFSFGNHSQLKGSEIIIAISLFFDFILYFQKPLVINGEILHSQSQLWNHYLKVQLKKHLLTIISLQFMYFDYFQIISLKEFIALILVFTTIDDLRQKLNNQIEVLIYKNVNNHLLDIFQLVLFISLFAHIMACLWYYIGYSTYNYGSWLHIYDIYDSSVWVKYNYSYYWALATMCTVGYGDIIPKNQIELAFCNIMMVLSGCLFGYSINSIGLIVKNMHDKNRKCKKDLSLMNNYMKKMSVDDQIQKKIQNYLNKRDENINDAYEEKLELIKSLPISLRIELDQDIKERILKQIKVLTHNFSLQTQNDLLSYITCVNFQEREFIFHANSHDDNCLYFIQDGEVQLVEEQSKNVIKTLKKGEIFGEYQFFTGKSNREACISVCHSQIYKLARNDLLKVIQLNSKDFQRFHNIKDVLQFQNSITLIYQKCSACLSQNHLMLDCPLIQYKPNYYINMLKDYQKINYRKHIQRSNYQYKTLLSQNQIKQQIKQFQISFQEEISESFTEDKNQSNENINSYNTFNQNSKLMFSDKNIINPDQQEENEPINNQTINFTNTLSMKRSEKQEFQGITQPVSISNLKNKKNVQSHKLVTNLTTQMTLKSVFEQDQHYNQNLFCIPNFDRLYNYVYYLPHNNVQEVLKNYRKLKKKFYFCKLKQQFTNGQ